MTTLYNYRATVIRVIDGDTIDFRVDLGFRVALDIRTRVRGINAPELREAAGKTARDALWALLPAGREVTIRTAKDPRDKYGRWLADIDYSGQDIGAWMIEHGYAVPFMEGAG